MTNEQLQDYARKLDTLIERRNVPDEIGPLTADLWGQEVDDLDCRPEDVPEHAVLVMYETSGYSEHGPEVEGYWMWIEGGLTERQTEVIDAAHAPYELLR